MLRDNCSDWSPVISGVPQGTILGPILFIIYTNHISANITSTVKICADETKIYRTINEPDKNIPALQLDLNKLSDWANKWQLRFNPAKREVMRVTHSRDRSKARFKRRILHVPNLMQMSENNRFSSFALDSAHIKCDV